MKAELSKTGKSITVYSPNVDEKYVYMHIFDKETLYIEQPPMSFEINIGES